MRRHNKVATVRHRPDAKNDLDKVTFGRSVDRQNSANVVRMAVVLVGGQKKFARWQV